MDVWVSAHGGQYSLHDKYKPRQTYSPDTFLDPQGFLDAITGLEERYLEYIAKEQRQGSGE